MFKSKVDFNAFDKNNTKVKDIELTKAKALAKAGVKKLANNPETPTNFHLAMNYFKDDKDKPLGHLVCFGENKKLDKHFLQVEMKSGKMDKSMTASQKEASMGKAYVKDIKGKATLCFEPDANSKIPGGKWPKLLKELKAFFAGMKAVVMLGGEVVGDEESMEETGEETTDMDTETVEEETTGETTEKETIEENTGNERNRAQRASQMKKMDEGVGKMNEAVGKAPKTKLTASVEKYEVALAKLIKAAEADGIIDDEEQAEIDALTEKIEQLKQAIEERGARLTDEHLKTMNENLTKVKQELEKMLEEFNS